jgi:ABC-type Fe3+ transport system permease subunit
MNVRRGLLRFWVIGSLLFAAGVAVFNSSTITAEFKKANDPLAPYIAEEGQGRPWSVIGQTAGLAVGVPIAVLLLGAMVGWAVRGFRSN